MAKSASILFILEITGRSGGFEAAGKRRFTPTVGPYQQFRCLFVSPFFCCPGSTDSKHTDPRQSSILDRLGGETVTFSVKVHMLQSERPAQKKQNRNETSTTWRSFRT
ncbi:hypothetical protein LIA77_06294 [Sarocladium implicatum]|nr:hypothetical protein LIA77_06294 [Sarocladium implicatum]